MFKAKIFIKRRRTILDPQGKAVELGIKSLGFQNVSNVRIDKYIELEINEDDEEKAKVEIEKICNSLLANPHLEDYFFELEKL
ncbi:MAG: phosphoribosylformylglycinamidine synthase subunit PurS [Ignavibacteria bacterium]|nr:phosphoribosylformylglycinamidine synthase subunit PurS [Ignavibacteria bacterium]